MKGSALEEAKKKIYRYCAYQERCHQEVTSKLYELGLGTNQVNEVIAHLIAEGFLNEERFAKAFAGGKFRLKKWGKLKIVHALQARGITPNCIRIALREIDDAAYQQTLSRLVRKKINEYPAENPFTLRDKIAKAIILKGFEPDRVWQEVKAQLPG